MKTINLKIRNRSFVVRPEFKVWLKKHGHDLLKERRLNRMLCKAMDSKKDWLVEELTCLAYWFMPDSAYLDDPEGRAKADVRKYNKGDLAAKHPAPKGIHAVLLDAKTSAKSQASDAADLLKQLGE